MFILVFSFVQVVPECFNFEILAFKWSVMCAIQRVELHAELHVVWSHFAQVVLSPLHLFVLELGKARVSLRRPGDGAGKLRRTR